jgi:hypothetical protein
MRNRILSLLLFSSFVLAGFRPSIQQASLEHHATALTHESIFVSSLSAPKPTSFASRRSSSHRVATLFAILPSACTLVNEGPVSRVGALTNSGSSLSAIFSVPPVRAPPASVFLS